MIQKLLPAILLPAVLLIGSCSKKGNNDKEVVVPVPNSQYDLSNFGLYRGVFVGSKGTVTVNIMNDNNVNATFRVDGSEYKFGTTQVIQQNQATTINFAGGGNSFTFSAAADGSNPVISNLVFTGHPNAKAVILKSLSNSWADIFECTYKENAPNTGTGVIMVAVVKLVAKGLVSDNSFQNVYLITGTQGNSHVVGTAAVPGGNMNIVGDVTTDNSMISGTFTAPGKTGTWSGVRVIE